MPLGRSLAPRQSAIWTSLVVVALATAPRPADAASKHAPSHARPRSKPAAKACPAPKEEPPPIVVAGSKVAVFAFTGDDAEPVRRQVMRLFKSKGMKILPNLRAVDSAEQYREMSATLNLVAYVDGEVTIEGNDGSATIYVRNGATGMRTASATFAADRHQLPASMGKELWDRIGPALGQACADAAKPRKSAREPMRINAGTPLTDADTAEATE
ncbi:MAG TPA: hypothetical protein VH853_23695 [Polyangia bacterium]|jgi:hypothetical protein|nr:hypothetical protein [Polyangia bacterium]